MADRSVEAWLDRVEDYWRQHRMPSRERRRLVTELMADLEEAISGGAVAGDLVAREVSVFAREVADAEGIVLAHEDRPAIPTRDELAKTATAGAVLGAAAAWVWMSSHFLISPALPEAAALALIYLIALGLVVGGGVVLVRWRYRRWDGAAHASRVGAAAALGGAIASIVPVAALAVLLGYSTALPSMVLFAAAGAGSCFVVSRFLFRRLSPYAPI